MADVLEVAEMIIKMVDGFEKAVMDSVGAHPREVEKAVREQLYSGLDGDLAYLDPTYDDDPYFNEPRRSAQEYKEWKLKITPPEPSMMLNLGARPEEVPNLFIDGTFYSDITANYDAGGMILSIDISESKSAEIVMKYGERILALSDNAVGYLNFEFVEDAIWDFFESCGW